MNKRIKELAEQVEKWIRTTNFEGMPEDEMTYDEIFQKKFAQLIIWECVEVANNHFESKEPGYPGDKIEEHFGVEK